MQITDPIADMLTRIRNAGSAKHATVDIPASNMKKAIAEILLEEGYIKNYQLINDGLQGIIRVTLKYNGNEKAITGLRRVSKPGLRVYAGADEQPPCTQRTGHRHYFHVKGHHDRQEGESCTCRRRSPCVCMVRGSSYVKNWKNTHCHSGRSRYYSGRGKCCNSKGTQGNSYKDS